MSRTENTISKWCLAKAKGVSEKLCNNAISGTIYVFCKCDVFFLSSLGRVATGWPHVYTLLSLQIQIYELSDSGETTLDSHYSRHSAKATYSPLSRWGEWRRDGPTYTSLSIQVLIYYQINSGEAPLRHYTQSLDIG
eukprot:6212200-Pleurochrysis_carterae.AAC.1